MIELISKNYERYWYLNVFLNYSEKWLKIIKKCKNWKWPLVSWTSIISASTWPKFKIKVSFEILRTSRFQNWLYFLNFVKIWWRYCKKQNWEIFRTTLYILNPVYRRKFQDIYIVWHQKLKWNGCSTFIWIEIHWNPALQSLRLIMICFHDAAL